MNKVDDYISKFPENVQKILERIRSIVRDTAPGAEENIAWQMPAYKLNGRPLIYFAAFKNHIGIYPLPETIGALKKELSKFKQGKGSIQFPFSDAIPYDLIRKLITERKKQLEDL